MRTLLALMAAALLCAPRLAAAEEPSTASASVQSIAPSTGAADDGEAKYPSYVVGGIISLVAGAAFVGGGMVAAVAEHPKTALGLTALGTVGLGVGVPLAMIGGADRHPEDSGLVGTGTALATPGVIGLGLGATILAERVAADEEPELALPLTVVGVGAAVAVTGLILWGSGADREEAADRGSARLMLGPTSASVVGAF